MRDVWNLSDLPAVLLSFWETLEVSRSGGSTMKSALFAAVLLVGLPTASYAQPVTQGTTLETGAGSSASAPQVKKVKKAKKSKTTKVRRTTTDTDQPAGVTTGTSTTGVSTGSGTTGTRGTVRSNTRGTVGQ